MEQDDTVFAGSIPLLYEECLVPLIFEPYAVDLARRVHERNPRRVLELAAGTGVVTRAMAETLPVDTRIVATDLNPAMLEQARIIGQVGHAASFAGNGGGDQAGSGGECPGVVFRRRYRLHGAGAWIVMFLQI